MHSCLHQPLSLFLRRAADGARSDCFPLKYYRCSSDSTHTRHCRSFLVSTSFAPPPLSLLMDGWMDGLMDGWMDLSLFTWVFSVEAERNARECAWKQTLWGDNSQRNEWLGLFSQISVWRPLSLMVLAWKNTFLLVQKAFLCALLQYEASTSKLIIRFTKY